MNRSKLAKLAAVTLAIGVVTPTAVGLANAASSVKNMALAAVTSCLPDTLVPDTIVADPIAADTTVADTIAPDTTMADTIAPDTTVEVTIPVEVLPIDCGMPNTPDTTIVIDPTIPTDPTVTLPPVTTPPVTDPLTPDTTTVDTMVPDTTVVDVVAPAPDTTVAQSTATRRVVALEAASASIADAVATALAPGASKQDIDSATKSVDRLMHDAKKLSGKESDAALLARIDAVMQTASGWKTSLEAAKHNGSNVSGDDDDDDEDEASENEGHSHGGQSAIIVGAPQTRGGHSESDDSDD